MTPFIISVVLVIGIAIGLGLATGPIADFLTTRRRDRYAHSLEFFHGQCVHEVTTEMLLRGMGGR